MARDGYTNLTIKNPIFIKKLEELRKKEHRRSISETLESILIPILGIKENEL
jgi:hypothetical protein